MVLIYNRICGPCPFNIGSIPYQLPVGVSVDSRLLDIAPIATMGDPIQPAADSVAAIGNMVIAYLYDTAFDYFEDPALLLWNVFAYTAFQGTTHRSLTCRQIEVLATLIPLKIGPNHPARMQYILRESPHFDYNTDGSALPAGGIRSLHPAELARILTWVPSDDAFPNTFAQRARSTCDLLVTVTRYSNPPPHSKHTLASHGLKLKFDWELTFLADQPPLGAADVNTPLAPGW